MQDQLLDILEKGLKDLDLEISDDKKHKLVEYLNLLLKWNKTYNLTSIKNSSDALNLHILDCLAIIKPIADVKKQYFSNKDVISLVDVGSGGGLPAVVLAIVLDFLNVYSVDSVEKKTTFVKTVASSLNLTNLTSIHTRIENFKTDFDIDIFISRAFASLSDFISLVDPLSTDKSIVLAMKGKYPSDELEELNAEKLNWNLINSINISVPGLEADRCLLIFKKG